MESTPLAQLLAEADNLYNAGRLPEALAVYQAVVEQDANQAAAHSRIGAIRAQTGDLPGAEHALLLALQIDPRLPQAHSNLGNLYYSRGSFAEALAKYQEATALDPDNPIYYENLHAAYKKLGKYEEAITALKRAHKLANEGVRAEARERYSETKEKMKSRLGCMGTAMLLLSILAIVTLVG